MEHERFLIEDDWLLSRRDLLRCAAGLVLVSGFGGTSLAYLLPQSKATAKGKAKSVIQVWLWGGPSHLDTFDPKPAAGYDYCGQFASPIKTNVDGIVINELLTELAKHADKYSLIRSMTHGVNAHETAAYLVQTGFKNGDGIVHPGVGAVVSFLKGAGKASLIPPYIVLTQLQGRFPEAGFLGVKAAPFATGGDPNATRFAVEGVVAEGVTDKRQHDRRDLLVKLDSMRAALKDHPQIKELVAAEDRAYELILGDTGKLFDLTQEKDDVRTRYGKNTFGQSCLMARRLVEKGVPYVTINSPGWDTHKQHFPAMRRLLPNLDKGLSSLLVDLSDRGLLDSTVVWCCGEFGRTPRVMWEPPWDGGRGHYGPVFSCLVAGGGFKGGQVVGESDARGEQVKSRPVYPCDLIGSVLELTGIDPASTLRDPQGAEVPVVPAGWEPGKPLALLKEIM